MERKFKREIRQSALVWIALMLLLALTTGSAFLGMGIWNSVANLGIAMIKAILVGIFFMHLKTARGVVRICIGVALLTLALLFAVSGSDYATREEYPAPWQAATPGAREPQK